MGAFQTTQMLGDAQPVEQPEQPKPPTLKDSLRSKVMGMLGNFKQGMGEAMQVQAGLPTQLKRKEIEASIADTMSQVHLRTVQADAMAPVPWINPETNQPMVDDAGKPMMMPKWFVQTQMANQGKVAAAGAAAKGRMNVAMTPERQAGQEYLDALDKGDNDTATAALEKLTKLRGAAKQSPMGGKLDPIILSQLGPMPDPTTNPQEAAEWGRKAEAIKTKMAIAPRVAGYMALNRGRYQQVYDPNTDEYRFMPAGEAADKGMVPAGLAFKNMPKLAQFNEMQTASKNLRESITNLDRDFTPTQRVKLSLAMASANEGALKNAVEAYLGTEQLTPAQQDFVIWATQLQERALSLRNVAGMGQGAEDMRKAIIRTLPGVKSADKGYALKQLAAFDQQVSSLFTGVGGKNQFPGTTGGGQQKAIEQFSPSRNQYRYSTDGGRTWQTGRAPK